MLRALQDGRRQMKPEFLIFLILMSLSHLPRFKKRNNCVELQTPIYSRFRVSAWTPELWLVTLDLYWPLIYAVDDDRPHLTWSLCFYGSMLKLPLHTLIVEDTFKKMHFKIRFFFFLFLLWCVNLIAQVKPEILIYFPSPDYLCSGLKEDNPDSIHLFQKVPRRDMT